MVGAAEEQEDEDALSGFISRPPIFFVQQGFTSPRIAAPCWRHQSTFKPVTSEAHGATLLAASDFAVAHSI